VFGVQLAPRCQKPVVMILLVWRLATWGVFSGDKGKPEKPATHGTWRKG